MFTRLNGWVVATCVAGAALAWLFVPSRLDLAFLKILDRDYAGARALLAGDAVATPLSAPETMLVAVAWALEGRQDEATTIIESLLARDPALKQTRDLLVHIDENDDLNALLPALLAGNVPESDPDWRLRQQMTIADAHGLTADVAAAIEQLRESGNANAAELVRLGLWYAARGVADRAMEALLAANHADPDSLDLAARRSMVFLLAQAGREQDVVPLARQWFAQDSEERQRFAYWMVERGWVSAAQQLVGLDGASELGALMAYADVQLGKDEAALGRLRGLAQAERLEERLLPYYASLALRRRAEADMALALPLLRTQVRAERGDAYTRELYVEILRVLQRTDELVEHWQRIERRTEPDDEQRGAVLRALVSLARYKEILPALRVLAEQSGEDWLAAYIAAAKQQRDFDGLADTLRIRVASGVASQAQQRSMAYVLLDTGKKMDAEKILMDLSAQADPSSSSVADLLYLFGPRPDERAMAWLIARARAAPVAQRAGWLRHIVARGGAQDVVRLAREWGSPLPLEARQVVVEAAVLMKDWNLFDQLFPNLIAQDRDQSARRRYAQWAGERGDAGLAEVAWRAVLEVSPNDATALKEVGMAMFARREFAAAVPFLYRYVDVVPQEWDVASALGDALWEIPRAREARQVYKQALQRMPDSAEMTLRQQLRRAVMAWRSGDMQTAGRTFEALNLTATGDPEVMAEYASFLLSQGKSHDAVRVLDEPNVQAVHRVVVR